MRTALLAAVALVAVPSVASATVLWRGDFETGDKSQWSKAQEVSPDRLRVVTSPVRQGKYALRVEVRQGDDPISSSGNRAELVYTVAEKENTERWYAWSTLWPADYPSEKTWQLFTQWHHSGSTGSPPLELYVNGETIHLRVNASTVVWTTPLVRGSWHDFVLHVYWSSDATKGYVELWYDNKLVLPKTFGRNMYPGQTNYLKQGLYRNEIIKPTGVLYHDGFTIATSGDDVLPKADAGADASDATSLDAASDAASDALDDTSTGEDATADTSSDTSVESDAPASDSSSSGDDAAPSVTPGQDDGGACGCRTVPSRNSLAAPFAVAAAILIVRRRRR